MRSRHSRSLFRMLAAAGPLLLVSCGGGDEGPTDPEPDPPTLSEVEVTPDEARLYSAGETLELSATARASDGSTLTRTFTWESSDPEIVSVTGDGLATAEGPPGSATITATTGGVEGTASIDVVVGPRGGTLHSVGGEATLVVPPGSVSEDVAITIEAVADVPDDSGLLEGAIFELGPDGTVFDPPATLTLAFDPNDLPDGLTSDDLTLLTEKDDVWRPVGNVTVEGGTVSGEIDGFSAKAAGARVAALEISPDELTLEEGGSDQLDAIARDRVAGLLRRRGATWTSADPTVVSVEGDDARAVVTALAAGTARISVTVEDVTAFIDVVVLGEELVVVTTSLPDAREGLPYEATLEASGGEGEYSWSIVAEGLPEGLELDDATGVISGTPTGGSATFTVQVTAGEEAATRELTIEVIPLLVLVTTELPGAAPGLEYSATLEATGGLEPYSWAVISGTLPAGLTLDESTGEISGTTEGESQEVTFEVTSADGQTATRVITVTVNEVLELVTEALPEGSVGAEYDETLAASGGAGDLEWSVVAGSLPTGLTLTASTGRISGTPEAIEDASFTIRVVSEDGQSAERAFTLTILEAMGPTVLEPGDFCGDFAGDDIVTFADAALEAGIREALDIDDMPEVEITCDLIATLLDAEDLNETGITDLLGLQNAVNLEQLGAEDNAISDLSPLSGLTSLDLVDLRGNQISDLGPLSGLTSLVELNLQDNAITDLGPLSGLTSLTDLDIDANAVSDLSPLAGLTLLNNLNFSDNSVADISVLSGLTLLHGVRARNNALTDISPLAGLNAMTGLDLAGNDITDIAPLEAMTLLFETDLDDNPDLSDVQPLFDNSGLGDGEPFGFFDQVHLAGTDVSCDDIYALGQQRVVVTSDCTGWDTFVVVTTSIPDPVNGEAYSATFETTGGNGFFEISQIGGVFPGGTTVDFHDARIEGTPTGAVGTEGSVTIRFTSGDGQTVDREFTYTVQAGGG